MLLFFFYRLVLYFKEPYCADRFLVVSFGFRVIAERSKEVLYTHQKKYLQCASQESTEPGYVNIKELAEAMCRYDLDDMDLFWLHVLNRELDRMGTEWGYNKITAVISQ